MSEPSHTDLFDLIRRAREHLNEILAELARWLNNAAQAVETENAAHAAQAAEAPAPETEFQPQPAGEDVNVAPPQTAAEPDGEPTPESVEAPPTDDAAPPEPVDAPAVDFQPAPAGSDIENAAAAVVPEQEEEMPAA